MFLSHTCSGSLFSFCFFVFWPQYIHGWFSSLFSRPLSKISWEQESTTHSDDREGSSELDETSSTPGSGISLGSAVVIAGLKFDIMYESGTAELLCWSELDGIQRPGFSIGLHDRLDIDVTDAFSTTPDEFFF